MPGTRNHIKKVKTTPGQRDLESLLVLLPSRVQTHGTELIIRALRSARLSDLQMCFALEYHARHCYRGLELRETPLWPMHRGFKQSAKKYERAINKIRGGGH